MGIPWEVVVRLDGSVFPVNWPAASLHGSLYAAEEPAGVVCLLESV
ncbi:hypothetical protein M1D89_18780 [Arthrobacter sp. D3-18]